MTLIKTSFWTGLSVAFRAISVFFISKIVALYTGPVGLALIEQFQNFMQIIRTFSGGLIQQGVVKYVSEYRDDENIKARMLSSALVVCMLVSLALGIFLFCFSSEIAVVMLQSIAYKKIMMIFSASIMLFSLNNLFSAILNGELEIRKFALCNIINSILVLITTTYLVIHDGLYGGLLALVFNQSIVLFFTLFLVVRCKWFKISSFLHGIDLESLSKILTYSLITIVGTLAVPLAQLLIRNEVASIFSWEDAGYWQAVTKLSNNFAILLDATLGVYYLPKFSALQSTRDLKTEIVQGYKLIFPLACITASFVFIFKKEIVILLYSRQFLPMLFLFKYQLIGDVARACAWLTSYVMFAKKMLKSLLVTEIFFFLFYPVATKTFIHYFGLVGTTMGFAVSNLFYWLLMLFFIVKYVQEEGFSSVQFNQ
jgi:polysaccharide transporter, PST family